MLTLLQKKINVYFDQILKDLQGTKNKELSLDSEENTIIKDAMMDLSKLDNAGDKNNIACGNLTERYKVLSNKYNKMMEEHHRIMKFHNMVVNAHNKLSNICYT